MKYKKIKYINYYISIVHYLFLLVLYIAFKIKVYLYVFKQVLSNCIDILFNYLVIIGIECLGFGFVSIVFDTSQIPKPLIHVEFQS